MSSTGKENEEGVPAVCGIIRAFCYDPPFGPASSRSLRFMVADLGAPRAAKLALTDLILRLESARNRLLLRGCHQYPAQCATVKACFAVPQNTERCCSIQFRRMPCASGGTPLVTRVWSETFPDFVSFYRATYGTSLIGVHETAIPGVGFVEAKQGAGDWSDAPVPDLVIGRVIRGSGMATIDLGAGRSHEPVVHARGIVVSPHSATSIYMEAPHLLRAIGIPYDILLDLSSDQGLPPTVTSTRFTALRSPIPSSTPYSTSSGTKARWAIPAVGSLPRRRCWPSRLVCPLKSGPP